MRLKPAGILIIVVIIAVLAYLAFKPRSRSFVKRQCNGDIFTSTKRGY